jgi:IS30 family transposase
MRYKHFSKSERYELSILLKKGYSMRSIASVLNKSPSSLSRELRRNKVKGKYDPKKAQHKSYVKRFYSKYWGMRIKGDSDLEKYIRSCLRKHWSPEQIAGRLRSKNNGQTIVSCRLIYKYIYGRYGYDLLKYLKYKGNKKRNGNLSKYHRITVKNRIFVDQRPAVINNRSRCGDFEGDTLGVPKYTRETLVAILDRKSRYFMAKRIPRLKHAIGGFKELLTQAHAHSITLDNGFENNRHGELEINKYFCHPYASWEKGSIENVFNIVREYIPKKKPLSAYSDEYISAMISEMNDTPRKCLNYSTPREIFEKEHLAKCCT